MVIKIVDLASVVYFVGVANVGVTAVVVGMS